MVGGANLYFFFKFFFRFFCVFRAITEVRAHCAPPKLNRVKSAKRILSENIDPITGTLDTNAATKAIMAHRNTPMQDTGIAPSVMLFGRRIRDHLPQSSKKLRPEWQTIADAREMALAKRALKALPSESKELQPLEIGGCV